MLPDILKNKWHPDTLGIGTIHKQNELNRSSSRFKKNEVDSNKSVYEIQYIIYTYCGKGVFTFIKEAEGEKYLALASSTRFSAACGLTISSP